MRKFGKFEEINEMVCWGNYPAPPELADLAREVARLGEENEKLEARLTELAQRTTKAEAVACHYAELTGQGGGAAGRGKRADGGEAHRIGQEW